MSFSQNIDSKAINPTRDSRIQDSVSNTSKMVFNAEKSYSRIISKRVNNSQHIIMNNPGTLNSIGTHEIEYLKHFIEAAENSLSVNTVIIKGSGRSFSSGGEVLELFEGVNSPLIKNKYKQAWDIWNIIVNMKKPYIAIMNGFSIGTGGGLAAHGAFRVATENTVFSMPEAAFGFVSDAGSSFYLNRLDNMIGTYIVLTAQYLKGADVFFSGIATHYVPSSRLGAMEHRISQLDSPDYDEIDSIIEEFSTDPGIDYRYTLKGNVVKTIKSCFKYNTVEEILEALCRDGSEFAMKTIKQMLELSPTSLKANLELMRRTSTMSFDSCMENESRAAMNVIFTPDFKEGVHARFIKHIQPKWCPATLSAVDIDHVRSEILDKQNDYTVNLHPKNVSRVYPFRCYGLPSDKDVQKIVQNPEMTFYGYHQVIRHFFKQNYKFGTLEKVIDILDRNTRSGDQGLEGKIEWIE